MKSSRSAIITIAKNREKLQVNIWRVRSWYTLSYPWEHEISANFAEKMYLSPGTYTFEVVCNSFLYAERSDFVARVDSGEEYTLGCNPKDEVENFTWEKARPN